MPELPEVETVRRGLARSIEGARIGRVKTRRSGLRYPFPDDLRERLEGGRITHLGRRAKYLLIALEDETVIISHLGMSGSWRVEEQGGEIKKHDHLIVDVVQKNQDLRLTYHDPRRFGFILLSHQSELEHHPMLHKLGIEPLGNELTTALLTQAFENKKTPIKTALLDQRIIAGLGNIYVCEALWQAQISPFLAAGELAGQENVLERLVASIRDVLTRAVQAGGSTLRDYAHIDGKQGYFQHQFHVYDRENAPCPRCGGAIVRKMQAGRSTFYCVACQPSNLDAI